MTEKDRRRDSHRSLAAELTVVIPMLKDTSQSVMTTSEFKMRIPPVDVVADVLYRPPVILNPINSTGPATPLVFSIHSTIRLLPPSTVHLSPVASLSAHSNVRGRLSHQPSETQFCSRVSPAASQSTVAPADAALTVDLMALVGTTTEESKRSCWFLLGSPPV